MKCAICKKELVGLINKVTVNQEISTHLDCFFEGIPNPPSRMEEGYEEKMIERNKLIDEKTYKIIEQYQQA